MVHRRSRAFIRLRTEELQRHDERRAKARAKLEELYLEARSADSRLPEPVKGIVSLIGLARLFAEVGPLDDFASWRLGTPLWRAQSVRTQKWQVRRPDQDLPQRAAATAADPQRAGVATRSARLSIRRVLPSQNRSREDGRNKGDDGRVEEARQDALGVDPLKGRLRRSARVHVSRCLRQGRLIGNKRNLRANNCPEMTASCLPLLRRWPASPSSVTPGRHHDIDQKVRLSRHRRGPRR